MSDYIARRATTIDASGIRKIWQMAVKMTDPVDFSIGQPDFDAADEVKEAAVSAINEGRNGYTLTMGLPELREKIAADAAAKLGWSNPTAIVTCGVSGALNLALMAVLNPGDEVLIPDPYFVMYRHLTNLYDGKCVYVDTYPDFQLTAERLETKITAKCKVLMLNSPGNPSGQIMDTEQLRAVAELARKHNLLVLSDEIYDAFSYDKPAVSIAEFYENTIVMKGLSKTYGIPGWRLGYMVLPNHMSELAERMGALQQYTFVCAPHPFQVAAMVALDSDVSGQVNAYRHKRDLVYEGLKDKFGLAKPAGAFYAFVPAPGGDATGFVKKAIEKNVLVIPGSVFSECDTHFRISYATSDEQIQKGIERLCSLVV